MFKYVDEWLDCILPQCRMLAAWHCFPRCSVYALLVTLCLHAVLTSVCQRASPHALDE